MLKVKLKLGENNFKWFEVTEKSIKNICAINTFGDCCVWGWESDIEGYETSFYFGELWGDFGADCYSLKCALDTYKLIKTFDKEELKKLDAYIEAFGYEICYSLDNYSDWWEIEKNS